MTGELFLGDLTLALSRLGVSGPEAGLVTRLLGFRAASATPTPEAPTVHAPTAPPPPAPTPTATVPAAPKAEPREVTTGLTFRPLTPRNPPEWSAPDAIPVHLDPMVSPPPTPLLRPAWTRGILVTALGMWLPEGDLDLEAAIPLIAARQPLAQLPRLPLRTLRRGVEVLVDRDLGPFVHDAQDVLASLRRVLPADRLLLRDFREDPREVEDDNGHPTPWSPRDAGRPVFVITENTRPTVWRDLARVAHRHGNPLVALIPATGRRFRLAAHVIPWDHDTTAPMARRRQERR